MSQSERERALHRALGECYGYLMVISTQDWTTEERAALRKLRITVGRLTAAALDTPQEPTPADELSYAQKRANETREPYYVGPDNLDGRPHWVYPQRLAAPEPTPAAPPAWDERDQSTVSDFERWWMRESTSSPLGDALDQVDIHTQALIVAFCKSAWLAAAPRPALSPDAAASSGDDKGEGR